MGDLPGLRGGDAYQRTEMMHRIFTNIYFILVGAVILAALAIRFGG